MKMQSQFFRQIQFITFLSLPLLYFSGCKCWQKITFNPPIQAPLAISFLDANRLLDVQVPRVRVTVLAPDNSVVTANGLPVSTIDIEGGVMCLGLKENVHPSDSTPYSFTLKAEADGYTTTFHNVLLKRKEQAYYIPVYMVKLDDPGPGMSSGSGQITIDPGGTKDTITIVPKYNNALKRTVEIVIPSGTVFKSNDVPVSADKLEYNIVYATADSAAGQRAFPGGTLITHAKDTSGSRIAGPDRPFYFESAGWFTLEMQAGKQQVNKFNQPVLITMPIPTGLVNPVTHDPYQEKELIPLWSLNNPGEAWLLENYIPISKTKNGLEARFYINHLSTWNLGFTTDVCPTDQMVIYTASNISRQSFFTELVDAITGKPFPAISDWHEYSTPGDTFFISNVPINRLLAFNIFNDSSLHILNASGTFQTCIDTPSIKISPIDSIKTINISFEVVSGTATFNPVCNNAVWYKYCNSCNPNDVSPVVVTGNNNPNLFCSTATGAFHFGGVALPVAAGLTSSTKSDIMLAQPVHAFDEADKSIYCIRLWYGGVINGDQTVSETIDFPIDFSVTSSDAETIRGRKLVNNTGTPISVTIEHSFDETAKVHRIRIRNGVTILAQCQTTQQLLPGDGDDQ